MNFANFYKHSFYRTSSGDFFCHFRFKIICFGLILTLFTMSLTRTAYNMVWEWAKIPPSLKSVVIFPQWWNFVQLCLTLIRSKKNVRITWHTPWVLLTLALFQQILLYQKMLIYIAFRYIISNSFNFFKSLKVVLIKMIMILLMWAKLTSLGLLKVRYFELKVKTS